MRDNFAQRYFTALLAELEAFLALCFLNSGYNMGKHPSPPW